MKRYCSAWFLTWKNTIAYGLENLCLDKLQKITLYFRCFFLHKSFSIFKLFLLDCSEKNPPFSYRWSLRILFCWVLTKHPASLLLRCPKLDKKETFWWDSNDVFFCRNHNLMLAISSQFMIPSKLQHNGRWLCKFLRPPLGRRMIRKAPSTPTATGSASTMSNWMLQLCFNSISTNIFVSGRR